MGKECENCKHYDCDRTVGYQECLNDYITEKELDKYFSMNEKGCPHWECRNRNKTI